MITCETLVLPPFQPDEQGLLCDGVSVPAIVEWKQRAVRTRAGADTTSRAYVGILRPFSVSERDKVVLPDGTTGPILDMGGFVSRATGRPIFVEVWLG